MQSLCSGYKLLLLNRHKSKMNYQDQQSVLILSCLRHSSIWGQPPATLLQTAKQVPLVPRPSYQFSPQQPIPPTSQQSHVPQSQYVNAPAPASASFTNVLETQSEGSGSGQYQHWASQYQITYSERPQQQQSQLLPPQPRPIAPNPSVQQAHPPFPQYHPQQSPYDMLQFWNSQNRR